MAKLRSSNIEPSTATTLALGASGDAALISSDSIKANTFQDLGGNSLWVSDGAGNLTSINTGLAATAGYKLLNTQIASGSASLTTAELDNTYDEYMFVFTDLLPVTTAVNFTFQASSDGGSSYSTTQTTSYYRAYHREDDTAYALGYDTNRDLAQSTSYQQLTSDLNNEADGNSCGILHFCKPWQLTFVKNYWSRFSTMTSTGSVSARAVGVGGYYNTASAIHSLSFKMSSGNFSGVIQTYGIS